MDTPPPRHHELDALRAAAMLLGIVLHAAMFLAPTDPYPIQDAWVAATPVEVNPYAYLLGAIHGFRMPVFFLLSGFFTALLWQRRGLRELARHRLKRIGLPLLLGTFTIIPLNLLLFSGGDPNLVTWAVVWEGGFHHLWFLWVLLWLAAAFLVAARLRVTFRHPLWWAAIPLAGVAQFFMSGSDFGPDLSLQPVPDPVVLVYYALFFALGAFLYQRSVAMRRWWAAVLPPTLLLVFPAGLLFVYSEEQGAWTRALAAALQAAYAWLMCFGLVGLFRMLAARERFWVRYVSDASYWLYLCHLPLVVAGQRLVLDWPLSVHLKFGAICVVVFAVLLIVYQLGVRYTPVGTMLNGPRARRRAAPTAHGEGGPA